MPRCEVCGGKSCLEGCIFAPYYSDDSNWRFQLIKDYFGKPHLKRIFQGMQELTDQQQRELITSLEEEAVGRLLDPVKGIAGIQLRVKNLETMAEKIEETLDKMKTRVGFVPQNGPNGSDPADGSVPNVMQIVNGSSAALTNPVGSYDPDSMHVVNYSSIAQTCPAMTNPVGGSDPDSMQVVDYSSVAQTYAVMTNPVGGSDPDSMQVVDYSSVAQTYAAPTNPDDDPIPDWMNIIDCSPTAQKDP